MTRRDENGRLVLTLEVVPYDDTTFAAVLLDIPMLVPGDEPRAARRGYFSAMSYAASHGVDVDGFYVREYNVDPESEAIIDGRYVGPGGFEVAS